MRNRRGLTAEVCRAPPLVLHEPSVYFLRLLFFVFYLLKLSATFLSVLPVFMMEGQVMVQKDEETDEIKSSDQSHADV